MGQRGSCTNEISIEDCRLPRKALLGKEGEGFKVAMMALDGGRIGIGSMAVGIGLAAIEYAAEYAKNRIQFGQTHRLLPGDSVDDRGQRSPSSKRRG